MKGRFVNYNIHKKRNSWER